MSTTIRRAVLSDLHGMATSHISSLTTAYADFLHPEDLALFTVESASERMSQYLAEDAFIFVAEVDGEIVGNCRWGEYPKAKMRFPALVNTLFIAPEHQGQGHGKKLLAASINHAIKRGHSGMVIGAFLDNPAAWMMYERWGAVRFFEGPLRFGQNDYTEVLMAWDDLHALLERLK